jgi:cell division protein FtsZ
MAFLEITQMIQPTQEVLKRTLTLYEVDEAATRIREEVDADANIIVGATFDESLDGIIRVSVVATGVNINVANNDRPAVSPHPSAPLQARAVHPGVM